MALVGISTDAFAQEQTDTQNSVDTTTDSEPQWLIIARQIIPLENARPYQRDNNESEAEGRVRVKKILEAEALFSQLLELTPEQLARAYRYMLERSKDERFSYVCMQSLLKVEPSSENARLAMPYFAQLSDQSKTYFFAEIALDGILLHPEVPEFRAFPARLLQQAARGENVARDLVSTAALMLVTQTTSAEKGWMHQALARDSKNAGLWNALTHLDDLTPAEVQQARQLFSARQSDAAWRLTLALALSPYDAKMSDLVREAVAAELRVQSEFDFAALLIPGAKPQKKLEKIATPGGLAALAHWELKKALPYLFRSLRVENPFVAKMAMSVLVTRAPQEVLRIARLPKARGEFFRLDYAVGWVSLLYPQFREQARQILDSGQPQDDEFKGYEQVTRELQRQGAAWLF